MNAEAILVDVQAIPRIILKQIPDAPINPNFISINVQVAGKIYQASTEAKLSHEVKSAKQLAALLDNLESKAVFSIWGLGDYRTEGPLLVCNLAGDGRGHFNVDMVFSESNLKLSDKFVTDQTCIKLFLEALENFKD